VGDAVQVVHVQASRHNAGANGEFDLTAGVYFPALAARLALFPPNDSPGEPDCQVRTRPMPRSPGSIAGPIGGPRTPTRGRRGSWGKRWSATRCPGWSAAATSGVLATISSGGGRSGGRWPRASSSATTRPRSGSMRRPWRRQSRSGPMSCGAGAEPMAWSLGRGVQVAEPPSGYRRAHPDCAA
jgi:hypothetical protein